jgi:hypothetical protein
MRLPGSSAGRVGGACSPCTGRGLTSRPCRQGRWWALTPPFHPYRPRLRRSATGGLFSVSLSVGFRRLPRVVRRCRERPALRCPDFPRAHSELTEQGPRSPGLQPGLYPGSSPIDSPVQAHRALGTAHEGALVEDELAADRALERRSAQHGEELLLERPVERSRGTQSSRNTPTTLPRIWTCGA